MIGIRFMSVGVLVTLIILSAAVSPVYARMSMGGGHGGNSGVIFDQINDIISKYNGNHSGLMQAFSGEFGDTFYIIVKNGFMSRSKYVYEAQIDSQGYVMVRDTSGGRMGRRGGGGGYDCDSNICMTTTRHDVKKVYDYFMANSNDYIMLDDVFGFSTKLWKTWFLNTGLLDEIQSWIQDEYLGNNPGGS